MADAHPPVPNSSAPVPMSKAQTFVRRLASSVALWTFVLLALFSGGSLFSNLLFLVVMLVIAVLGLQEFYGMVQKAGLACFRKSGLVGGVILMAGTFLYLHLHPDGAAAGVNDFETGILILFV